MNKLRQEIRTILDGTDSSRPAALRRCRREDWLYATDLPQAASGEAVDAFLRMMESSGWRARQEAGWILLDRIPEMPPEGFFSGPFGPEARCCLSLLQRHPDRKGNADHAIRMLLKAGEEGPDAYERACGVLHREWAASLRKGEVLPGMATLYFGE